MGFLSPAGVCEGLRGSSDNQGTTQLSGRVDGTGRTDGRRLQRLLMPPRLDFGLPGTALSFKDSGLAERPPWAVFVYESLSPVDKWLPRTAALILLREDTYSDTCSFLESIITYLVHSVFFLRSANVKSFASLSLPVVCARKLS